MTVEAMMTETVTRQRIAGFVQDEIGEAEPIYEEATTVMYLEPRSDRMRASESREAGYVPIGDWHAVGPWDFDFGSQDRIVWGEKVFDIVSPPRVMPNPRLGTMSHTELDLQLVGDPEDAS